MHRNRIATATIIFLMLTFALFFAKAPAVNAATEVDTYAYVTATPNPVGVGQEVVVEFRIDKLNPLAFGTSGGEHFTGFTVKITKPDGTVETKGPFTVESTSGSWFKYVPTQVGTYKFQTTFPGQQATGFDMLNGVFVDNIYKPSTSAIQELTVQQEPIPAYPGVPLPTDYWTRPIYGENKGWSEVADNWLMRSYDHMSRGFTITTAFAPYTSAPNSAHVLWKKPIIFGGIAGGMFGDMTYYTGLSYEQFYTPLIIQGRIIYTEHGPTTPAAFGTHCIDLYTGEEIWFLNNTDIELAQILDIETPNEHGVVAYLWSTSGPYTNSTWYMHDAFTGRQILTVMNITWGGPGGFNGGPTAFGPNGEILSYTLDPVGNWLAMWNSTKAIYRQGFIDEWSPVYGDVMDGSEGIQWNVSIPDVPGMQSISTIGEGYILAQSRDTSGYPFVYTDVAYDQKTGQQLWVQNRTDIYSAFFRQPQNIGDGVYTLHDEGKLQVHGFSIKTGQELWATERETSQWAVFTYQQHIAYGKLYTSSYTGHVRAYYVTNGTLAWDYHFGSAGYETPYGEWPTYNSFAIADGKIYVSNDEHSPDAVPWRGGKLWCIDAETGKGLWNVSGWLRNPVIADGILTALNSLDGQVYTFGKGPSATTVTAPKTQVTLGESLVIEGTVLDKSIGQPDTPCISDEDMSAWMEYVHMQKPMPTNAKGVDVSLYVVDSNNNFRSIGTATSDLSGVYSLVWKPDVPGKYTVIATFAGSESYGSSTARTNFYVEEAVSAVTPEPTQQPASMADLYFMPVSIVLIIVVVAVLVMMILMFRKR